LLFEEKKEMTLRTPKVSVFIPTFNRADMLRDAIESVLQQTYDDFELIISDNASDDATESVVRSFDDSRIRYVKNDHNIGSRENWRRCFALAKGEYMAIFPDDDLMLPENLERKVRVLSGNERIGLVHSKYDIIDVDGRIVESNADPWGIPDRVDCLENRQEMLYHWTNCIKCSSVVFRRDCVDKIGQFTDKLWTGWDYEYWLRISAYYEIAFLASPLIRNRIHNKRESAEFYGDDQHLMFTIDMDVKRLFIKNHFGALSDGRRVKLKMWRRMGERLKWVVENLQDKGLSKARIRTLVLKDCLNYPELYYSSAVYKVILKSVIGRRAATAFKRLLFTIMAVARLDSMQC
jgi:glycosyltransferase involved in cell wall biosynthesis